MKQMKMIIVSSLIGVAFLIAQAATTENSYALSSDPTITYTVTPAPNSNGWNNSAVTVTFICSDGFAVAYCTPPTTLSNEGTNQTVSGTVMSALGTVRNITTNPINIDKTAPAISDLSLTYRFIFFRSHEIITASASDMLSGVTSGEYYIDTDPGQGNGTVMQFANGKLTATTTLGPRLGFGRHKLFVRSKDNAGNWSIPTSLNFYVL